MSKVTISESKLREMIAESVCEVLKENGVQNQKSILSQAIPYASDMLRQMQMVENGAANGDYKTQSFKIKQSLKKITEIVNQWEIGSAQQANLPGPKYFNNSNAPEFKAANNTLQKMKQNN